VVVSLVNYLVRHSGDTSHGFGKTGNRVWKKNHYISGKAETKKKRASLSKHLTD